MWSDVGLQHVTNSSQTVAFDAHDTSIWRHNERVLVSSIWSHEECVSTFLYVFPSIARTVRIARGADVALPKRYAPMCASEFAPVDSRNRERYCYWIFPRGAGVWQLA